MPKDYLFPTIPGVSRVVALTGNRAYGIDLLGTLVSLSGHSLALNLVSPSSKGIFMICGPGNLTGSLTAELSGTQAIYVAVDGGFKFVDGGEAAMAALAAHEAAQNPHSVTKSQVGLGNVDNTPDAQKPVSAAQAAALAGKSPLGHTHPALTRTEIQGHPSNQILGNHATGQISFDDDYIEDGDTLFVAGVVFTYRDEPIAPRDIEIGDGAGVTIAANTAAVLEGNLDTILHASNGSASPWIVDLVAAQEGASGNSIGISGVFSNPAAAVFSGSTLSGGVDGVTPLVASYLGQECRVGDSPGPFVWYRWDGYEWKPGLGSIASVNEAVSIASSADKAALRLALLGVQSYANSDAALTAGLVVGCTFFNTTTSRLEAVTGGNVIA